MVREVNKVWWLEPSMALLNPLARVNSRQPFVFRASQNGQSQMSQKIAVGEPPAGYDLCSPEYRQESLEQRRVLKPPRILSERTLRVSITDAAQRGTVTLSPL
jgi:hypothetical protein